ncbi:MAG: MFS transporter [Bradyrhizobiaceae bacterium]|nr:MFS transporter [Bradyrhizobiaceae bacterium]
MASPDPSDANRQDRAAEPRELERILVFLMIAGFAVALNIRITDPLLPSLAAEFQSTPGRVAIVSVFYAAAHGVMQFAGGPLGDRLGKLRVLTLATAAAAITTIACSFATSIATLSAFRFLSGATAAIAFPLALAYLGDTVPYENRQATIARMLGAAMLGTMVGQAVSGVIADFVGWRAVFLFVAAMFAVAAGGLVWVHGLRTAKIQREGNPSLFSDFLSPFLLLRRPQVRLLLSVTAAEGVLALGATTFFGAYLHDRFGLSYSQIGLVLALFGAGGIAYTVAAPRLIARLGERGLIAVGGAVFCVFFLAVALTPVWQPIPLLLFVCGAALIMLHNTLQVRATQMAPEARGAAISAFAASFFLGQLGGVALWGVVYDRIGGAAVFATGAILFAGVVILLLRYLEAPSQTT